VLIERIDARFAVWEITLQKFWTGFLGSNQRKEAKKEISCGISVVNRVSWFTDADF